MELAHPGIRPFQSQRTGARGTSMARITLLFPIWILISLRYLYFDLQGAVNWQRFRFVFLRILA
jgi:hypothetical protein